MQANLTLQSAAAALSRGEVLAYPTEAVWGLGCDPFNEAALLTLLHLKQRSPSKGLIVVGSERAQLEPFMLPSNSKTEDFIAKYWPGTTLLLPKSASCPSLVSGEHHKVALRLTTHPLIVALCDLVGSAIVSTSANPAAFPPAKTEAEVRAYFGSALLVLPGSLGGGTSVSRIIDAESGQILR